MKYLYGEAHESSVLPEIKELVDESFERGLQYCFQNQLFCDCQIHFQEGKSIAVHKLIISAR